MRGRSWVWEVAEEDIHGRARAKEPRDPSSKQVVTGWHCTCIIWYVTMVFIQTTKLHKLKLILVVARVGLVHNLAAWPVGPRMNQRV
jgi:hypothetical protein